MSNDKKYMARIITLNLAAIIMSIICNFFPALRVLVFWIGALFIVIAYISKNTFTAIASFFVYATVVFFLNGSTSMVLQATTMIAPSITLGFLMQESRFKDVDYIISTMMTAIFFMYFFKSYENASTWEDIEKYLQLSIQSMPDVNATLLKNNISTLIRTIRDLMPALIIIFAMIYNIFSKYIAISIIRKYDAENTELKRFIHFYVPREIGLIFALSYIAVNVLSFTRVITDEAAQIIVMNIMYVLSFALAFQGLAVIMFIAANLKMKLLRYILSLIGLIMFLFINPPLVIVALIDIFVDLRKLGFRRSK